MIREGSSTGALAIAARGSLQLLVRFRRVDQGVIEDLPVLRGEGDLLVRIDHALRGGHRVCEHEIGHARFLIGGCPFKLALGCGIQAQVHAIALHFGTSAHRTLQHSRHWGKYAISAYQSRSRSEIFSRPPCPRAPRTDLVADVRECCGPEGFLHNPRISSCSGGAMRCLLLALPPAVLLAFGARAGDPPVTVKTLVATDKTVLGQPLVLPKRDPELIVSIYEIAPGARLPRHEHPFSR